MSRGPRHLAKPLKERKPKPMPSIVQKKVRPPSPEPEPLPVDPPPPVVPLMVSLRALKPHMCKYPIGHPFEADFGFCGHPRVDGRPYCLEHCQLSYRAPFKRERLEHVARLA